jgi:hypothetical protein
MSNIDRLNGIDRDELSAIESEARRASERIFSAMRVGAAAAAGFPTNSVSQHRTTRERNALFVKTYLTILEEVTTAAEKVAAKAAGHETWAELEAAASTPETRCARRGPWR